MKNLYILILFLIFLGCKNEEKTSPNKAAAEKAHAMDNIETIPEWLQYEVNKALPSDSLNIWIPTGNIETSSMVRVPRFPITYSKTRLADTSFDLNRYKINLVNDSMEFKISGVKNEQISAQIAIAAKQSISNLTIDVSDFVSGTSGQIEKGNLKVRYAKFVPVQRARSELSWTSTPEKIYGPEVSGFGMPDVVADPLVELKTVSVPAFRAQPIWFTFYIPKNTDPGSYRGVVSIKSNEFQNKSISITIEVVDTEIPNPRDYKFFLDLWLNPKAIAIANNLQLWSEKHWSLIEKYMDDLVSRGAKTITTTITHDPWKIDWINGKRHSQTGIGYAPMIQWNLSKDNTWTYDYSVFDRYVTLGLKSGLKERIDVFSLTPFEWGGKRYVTYFDEVKGEIKERAYLQSDVQYETIWIQFLRDFEKHLKSKGWFEKTYLSFDESPKEVIESILKIVSEGAPDFLNRFSIAGKPITSDMAQSLSVFYDHFAPEHNENKPINELLSERRKANKNTTLYLCGEPAHPNTFTFSPAIESQLIPWLALKYNTDGYLRWAYNSWSNSDPYKNPVFNFIQGDDYYVYPGENGPVSSIRWELLKEGIEDFELFKVVEGQGRISNENLQKVIEITTRNVDGKYKNTDDFIKTRKIILKQFNDNL